MEKKTIYVLHERGNNSHYNALVYLAQSRGWRVDFRVMSPLLKLAHILLRKYTIAEWLRDIRFLLSLPFTKERKVVIGIAPYNRRLSLMMRMLRRHEVYYHTSYTCWDGSRWEHPIGSKANATAWRQFTTTYVKHIFAVSEKTKRELLRNALVEEQRISVVNHSYNIPIAPTQSHDMEPTFIFVGRIREAKGIRQLLEIFGRRRDIRLIIVGRGNQQTLVQEYVKRHDNILYRGYIRGLSNIVPLYQQASFVLINSKRTGGWEELFGITIIEGMACGCIPIATDHPGPMEIIEDGVSGFICHEGQIEQGIDRALALTPQAYQCMRTAAIQQGQMYTSERMAQRWKAIFADEENGKR